jgi:predicted CoA-substrate-specific enzyme activase
MVSVGIDVGSLMTRALVLVDDRVAGSSSGPTGGGGLDRIRELLEKALAAARKTALQIDAMCYAGTTADQLPFPGRPVSEIACVALGARRLVSEARTVIDLGAEHARVVRIGESGRPADYEVNGACASGTGVFLDTIARALEVQTAEIGPLALASAREETITSTCAVFAESEVIGLVARGVEVPAILRGLLRAISGRIATQVSRLGLRRELVIVGGGGLNVGLRHFLQERLGCDILVPESPQLVGALGAAALAATGR